MAAKTGGLLWY